MFEGRFFLGVGTGENLNEHVLGDRWPPPDVRRAMLEEALDVMRKLWKGELTTHRGPHYTVENARLYTVPADGPEVAVAAGGPEAGELAGRLGDALVVTSPDSEVIEAFRRAGGEGRPVVGQLTVCVADDEEHAVRVALDWWPNGGLKGTLSQELPLPSHFEAASAMVTLDAIREEVVCGADPARHAEAIDAFVEAGVDHVYVHQVGPDQREMLSFYEHQVVPLLDVQEGAAIGAPAAAAQAGAPRSDRRSPRPGAIRVSGPDGARRRRWAGTTARHYRSPDGREASVSSESAPLSSPSSGITSGPAQLAGGSDAGNDSRPASSTSGDSGSSGVAVMAVAIPRLAHGETQALQRLTTGLARAGARSRRCRRAQIARRRPSAVITPHRSRRAARPPAWTRASRAGAGRS